MGTAASSGSRRVYLHIGAPKTGTSYLQSVMSANRRALREEGVLYPGEALSHFHAAMDLQGIDFAGHKDPMVPGSWARVVEEVRAWDGTSVISQELFSPARPEHVARAMESLDFAEIHVIFTARDLLRQIPAAWQEDLKNRNTLTLEEFLASLKAPPEKRCPLGRGFWRMQDAVEVLGRWAAILPPERVHVVTVPQSGAGRGVLWERFCEVIGISPEKYKTSAASPNTSLGAAEACMLRRLNLALPENVRWPTYDYDVKKLLGSETLGGRPDPIKIVLPETERTWVQAAARAQVAGLRNAGYDIVGDLAELLPQVSAVAEAPARHPDSVADEEMLPPAIESMAALLLGLQHRRDEAESLATERDALIAEVHRLQNALSEESSRLQSTAAKPLAKIIFHRFAEKSRMAKLLLVAYWNLVEGARRIRRRRFGAH